MAPNLVECADSHTPAWLTKDYMQQALVTYYKDETVHLREFCVVPALSKGENYGSVIYRIKVQYTLGRGSTTVRSASYIIKTTFENDNFADEKMKPYDFYNRELIIYRDIVPKLQAILSELHEEKSFFVETIKVDMQHAAAIFVDLQAAGFEMANRLECLDMAHIELVLEKLAKMHAATVILNSRENGALQCYDRGFFNRHTDVYKSFFVENIKACAHVLRQIEDMAEYGEKLLGLQNVYMELGARVFDALHGQVNVLNHGDLWTNNMMFRYAQGSRRPIDVMFLDFQCAAWASPAVDLHYLFNTSLQPAVQLEKQPQLFQHYYKTFRRTLESVAKPAKYRICSLHRFQLEMQAKAFYAFHSACAVQPVMLNEINADADYHALMGVDERAQRFKRMLYQNKKIQHKLRILLPIFEHLGLLETEQ